ncbi:phosphonate ABC transporter ATP-binding protein [Propioniferax innocua]|uniref:Phosphonate transport system ATP-binding protein n=1 Tax=Propioniferax innocua TaxID=1753 RepID=A0A542ZAK4_9ACTN|nr:phosphonate ABC transporter ATP-binding protein [Propioniferax innocua]TQL57345.1 phosphonate transport system ATP-binding protein [Propioniferax innocua]
MIAFKEVNKIYPNGVRGLRDVDFEMRRGEFVALIGLSGAGKSTLLRTVNGITEPTSGEVEVDGRVVGGSREDLRRLRGRIGMIFQGFNLVGPSTVQHNVIVGRLSHKHPVLGTLGLFNRRDYQLVERALDRVGLANKLHQRADQLSGGQQQRVAIARALVQEPSVLLADEPVASLDPVSTDRVMSDLRRVRDELELTVLVSLHSVPLARRWATRIIGMRDGMVVFDGTPQEATDTRLGEIYGDAYRAMNEAQQLPESRGSDGKGPAEGGEDCDVEECRTP